MNAKLFPLLAVFFLAGHGQADPFRSDPLPDGFDPFNPDANKPSPAKEFRVSKAKASAANRELFAKLWEALKNPRFKDGAHRRTFWITQAAGKVDGLTRYLTGDEAVILRNADLFEGSNVTAWVNPGGVYDFKSVGAGMRRVRQFKEALAEEDPDAPTQEEFVERLKAGETFAVRILDPKGCATCNGDGQMTSLQGGGNCKSCQGTGEILQTYTLKW